MSAQYLADRAVINRRNAQLSTGPSTPEGKAASCRNAVKTGLTGRAVLLPSEDAGRYEQHLAEYSSELQPASPRERELVQSLADTSWRLQRIPGLESALYTRGRLEFADRVAFQDPAHRAALLDLETHLKYEKQLKNLQLQEARLARRYEKEIKELRSLQKQRTAQAEERAKTQPAQPPVAVPQNQPAPAGFVFSSAPLSPAQPVCASAALAPDHSLSS